MTRRKRLARVEQVVGEALQDKHDQEQAAYYASLTAEELKAQLDELIPGWDVDESQALRARLEAMTYEEIQAELARMEAEWPAEQVRAELRRLLQAPI